MATVNQVFYSNTSPNGYKLSMTLNQASQSIPSNYSNVDWTLKLHSGNTSCNYNNQTVSASVNGESVYNAVRNVTIGLNTTVTLASGTKQVSHNSDGTKSVATSFTWNPSGGGTYLPNANLTGSGTYTLDKIARASSFTMPTSVDYGATFNVTITRADASFTHDVTIALPGNTTTITGVGTAFATPFQIPLTWLSGYTNGVKASGTVTIQTKQGTTNIGSAVSKTFDAPVPASVVPTLTFNQPTVTSGLAGYSGSIVGISSIACAGSASGVYSSTISKIEWSTSGFSGTGGTFNFTPNSTSHTITCVATDTRGRTATVQRTVASVVYTAPRLSITAYRCTSAGVQSDEGQYIRFTPTFTYTVLGTANSPTLTASINTSPVTNHSNASPVSGTASTAIGNNTVLKTAQYTLTVTLTDKMNRSASATYFIPTSSVLLNFPGAGNALGIGQYSTGANKLEVGWDTYINADLAVNGGLTIASKSLLDYVYPVGAVYISVVSTSPATLFGGTWAVFGTGRALVGIDTGQTEFNTIEKTGGAKTHTLTEAEMPSHNHTQNAHNHTQNAHSHTVPNVWVNETGLTVPLNKGTTYPSDSKVQTSSSVTATNNATTATNNATGGGGAHNNLQPYITVYMWKRTA